MIDIQQDTTKTLQKYYDRLFQDGKLVCVSIGMWGMSYSLTEGDIKLDNKLPDVIKLGKKMLIKPEVYNKFKSLQGRARNYLYGNSHRLPTVPQSHFVSKKMFLAVYKELEKYKNEFYALVDEFVEKYEDYKKEAIDFYKNNSKLVDVGALDTLYPSKEDVRTKFYFEIISYEIAMPTEFAAVDVHKEIDRERAADQAKQEEQAKYADIYQEQLDNHLGKINTFVADVVAELRGKVVEHCTVVVDKLKKKEVASEASVKTLLQHISEFRTLNFVEDTKINNKLNEIETLLTKDSAVQDDKEAAVVLRTHLEDLIKEAEDLSDVRDISGEYFRRLAV